jgi:hypothetical protein
LRNGKNSWTFNALKFCKIARLYFRNHLTDFCGNQSRAAAVVTMA